MSTGSGERRFTSSALLGAPWQILTRWILRPVAATSELIVPSSSVAIRSPPEPAFKRVSSATLDALREGHRAGRARAAGDGGALAASFLDLAADVRAVVRVQAAALDLECRLFRRSRKRLDVI